MGEKTTTLSGDPERIGRWVGRRLAGALRPLFGAGIPVWLAGGALRDLLSGRTPRDFDLLVPVDDAVLSALLPEGKWVGRAFRTMTLPRPPERAGKTGRQDRSPGRGGALQIGVFSGDLRAELGRRDFSINALALRIDPGKDPGVELIDPFGGVSDLGRGILRRPDPGRDPFREDPVRVLRLARFVSEFGFSVEGETLDAARASVSGLREIAGERMRTEWLKLFSGRFLSGMSERLPPEFVESMIGFLAGGATGEGDWKNREGDGSGGRALPDALRKASRFSRFDPLFRLWVFLRAEGVLGEKGGRPGPLKALPFSRAERRRLSGWSRLGEFLGSGREEGMWTVSDRSRVLDGKKDHLKEIVDLLARELPKRERKRFRERVERTVRELSRPWDEIGNRLKRVKKGTKTVFLPESGREGRGQSWTAQEPIE